MANVRRPRTDQELANDEREALIEQLQQDQVNLEVENQEKLAQAGEPEAREAVAALRSVSRGNVFRMTPEQQEAVGMADAAAEATATHVEDERDTQTRVTILRQKIAQQKAEQEQTRKEMHVNERARGLMKNHWQRWAREGEDNYSKACANFRLNVGRDAVVLVEGGVFQNHLDVAVFLSRMTPTKVEAKEADWVDDLEEELRQLRGED